MLDLVSRNPSKEAKVVMQKAMKKAAEDQENLLTFR